VVGCQFTIEQITGNPSASWNARRLPKVILDGHEVGIVENVRWP